ncbi:hypothetical protein C2G38_2310037 [Gigaspora rosea]|uniref:Uncharacterized protein n=1 Tax=Gigaspora rosea TaxID=44941 RepID=A0A397V824_9GLOM|nr:hypothetical protein C2G38_2310037 [Gigaspora rosea]
MACKVMLKTISDDRKVQDWVIFKSDGQEKSYEFGKGYELSKIASVSSDENKCKTIKKFKSKKRAILKQLINKVQESDNWYIEDKSTKKKLRIIAKKLEKCKEVEIFTDGSVDTKAQGQGKKKLGIEFVSTEENSAMERRKNLVKGLLSKETLQDFNKNLGLKSSQISKLCARLVNSFWKVFYERIWKFRCEMVNEWEVTQNITIKVKQKRRENQHESSKEKWKVRLGKRKLEKKENGYSQEVELSRKKSKVLRVAFDTVKDIVHNNIKPAWSSVIGACIKDRK